MNRKIVLFIFFAAFLQVSTANVPVFVYKAVSQVLRHVMGEKIQKAALKLHQKLDKTLGKDVSIADVATMDVDMVSVVEPYQKHAIATDYLAAKAATNFGHLEPITKSILSKERIIKSKHDIAQNFLSELIGLYMVLNESDSASVEVLLSTKPCLLSNTDHYFNKVPDPCKLLANESVSKIIERFVNVDKLRKSLGELLKFSSEWDNHWRPVYFRLNMYVEELPLNKSQKSSWDKIKEMIDSTRVL